MAFSLWSERSVAAASPSTPLAALARWFARAQAARTRRKALLELLQLDAERLADLGLSRADIVSALMAGNTHSLQTLTMARARRARS